MPSSEVRWRRASWRTAWCRRRSTLASAHESMLGDLVSFTASDPMTAYCSALLCHGGPATREAGARPRFERSDALAQQSAVRLLSAVAGNGATLYLAAVLISMEILVDLLEPPSDVSIAETQFSGVHLAGVAWHELKASSEVGGLMTVSAAHSRRWAARCPPACARGTRACCAAGRAGRRLGVRQRALPRRPGGAVAAARVAGGRAERRRLLLRQHDAQGALDVPRCDGLATEAATSAARLEADAPARPRARRRHRPRYMHW